jgi:putative transposase
MIAVFGVSRSGYYAWVKRCQNPPARQLAQQAMDTQVKLAFDSSKQRDGTRRIQVELEDQGHQYDIKTIGRSMKRQNLVAKAARKFKVSTDSNHRLPVAPNLLGQNFDADKPNQKWAGDITYLYTSEGWLYLAVMIDSHSRAVIGWSMSTRMTADLVCDALSMTLWHRGFPKGVIVHSDRGSQYCSKTYRKIIDKHQLQQV